MRCEAEAGMIGVRTIVATRGPDEYGLGQGRAPGLSNTISDELDEQDEWNPARPRHRRAMRKKQRRFCESVRDARMIAPRFIRPISSSNWLMPPGRTALERLTPPARRTA